MPTLEFSQIVEPALIGINRAWVFMGLGVNASLDPDCSGFRLPDLDHIKLLPDDMPKAIVEEFKREFGMWVVSNGLRELIETWDVFLDQLYYAAVYTDYWQQSQETAKLSPEPFMKRATAFAREGTREKLERLQKQFGITLQYQAEIESIKKARNCLTHRMGTVGPKDVEPGTSLTVRWRSPELFGINEDGTEFVPPLDSFPIHFPMGSPVKFRNVNRAKVVSLGDRLKFLPAEVKELCYTFRIAVDDAREAFTGLVLRSGGTIALPPIDPMSTSLDAGE